MSSRNPEIEKPQRLSLRPSGLFEAFVAQISSFTISESIFFVKLFSECVKECDKAK
jgi:hypothetical protein